MRVPQIQIPKIPEEEKTPIISQLLEITEQQAVIIQLQADQGSALALIREAKPPS